MNELNTNPENNHIQCFTADANSKIALVGNPNVGKSVTFNLLTGQYVVVSNYPGTTVDISSGKMPMNSNMSVEIIDTPGTNSLIPKSEDEEVTRDVLWREDINFALQVADYKNLRRSLLITFELIEMKIPLILNLNMEDEAEERGIFINKAKLSSMLGDIAVVCTTAILKKGLGELKKSMSEFSRSSLTIDYSEKVENICRKLCDLMPKEFRFKRPAALMLISGDRSVLKHFDESNAAELENVLTAFPPGELSALSSSIFESREKSIENIISSVYTIAEPDKKRTFRHNLGLWLTDIKTGSLIFIAVLYILYLFVGIFGAGTCVDYLQTTIFGRVIDGVAQGGYINPFFINFFDAVFGHKNIVTRMFVGEYGLLTMGMTYAIAIVLPIMFTFFFSFSFLEDSGYLPRLTVLSDLIFKHIGLNGKAILPIVLGLGCGTMAILTTRILDSKKERLIATIILALGIPCSAQLGVMMGLTAKIAWYATVLIFLVVLLQVIIVSKLSAYYIPGDASPFIMELPPIRFPQLWNIIKKTYNRVLWFLEEVVPLFLTGTFILFVLAETGFLKALEIFFSPVITGMLGLPKEATFAFIMGFLRRDYGAAGLYTLSEKGLLNPAQIMVALVVITLFVPCIATFFMMVKERGYKIATLILLLITPYAFFVGWLFRLFLISISP
ncbi:MAG TPA: ferrous iron transport protein B, partial [Candidatus Wallbacteria bacterium]|nr:ferrous iron transport protein B [Candidatus Wallbacteria bacterium]